MTTPAVIPVSAVNIRMKFPEFSDVNDAPDALIEFALEEAALFTETYQGKGKNLAQMYLTAHILAIGAYASETGGRDVSAETIGRISIRYRSLGKDTVLGDISSTVYGRRYQQIQGLNIRAFDVIAQPTSGTRGACGPFEA